MMAPGRDIRDRRVGPHGRPTPDAVLLDRFLADSHIFSTTVREVLGVACLAEVSNLPLTLAQLRLLKVLMVDGRRNVSEVAGLLGITSPAASKCLDRLEGMGLIVRGPSSTDRRATLLSVSDEGRRLVRDCERAERRRVESALAGYDATEITQLNHVLEQLVTSLLEQERPRRGYCLRCGVHVEGACPVDRVRGRCPFDELRRARPKETNI
jgi:DNA-binding MarR family transcriptional regulator